MTHDPYPMIIDIHTHIFPPDVRERRDDFGRRDPTFAEMYGNPKAKIATAEDLLASMDEAGVDFSVVLGFAWRDHYDIVRHNDYLLDAAAKSGGRIIPFATINMSDDGAEAEIERCAKAGARGIGELRPENQGWSLDGDAGEALGDFARRLGLMLLFHVTEPGHRSYSGRRGCELESFRAFAERHLDLRIIGAHLGGGFYAGTPPAATPYVDTAAQPFLRPGEHAALAIACASADRLLFGSDFPLISQARQIAELRAAIPNGARLEAALGGNAEALIGPTYIKPATSQNLRLFVAIELPGGVRATLNDLQQNLQRDPVLSRLRWVRPEGIHVTLKFLGAVPAERLPEIEAAVTRAVVAIPPFGLHLGKLGTFGSPRSPRVLWVEVVGDLDTLAKLQSHVEAELGPLGFPAEPRRFSPHLTLARVPPERAADAARPLAEAVASPHDPDGRFRVEALALMKSDLQQGGAIYTQLFAAPLN